MAGGAKPANAPGDMEVITSSDLNNFCSGKHDISAIDFHVWMGMSQRKATGNKELRYDSASGSVVESDQIGGYLVEWAHSSVTLKK